MESWNIQDVMEKMERRTGKAPAGKHLIFVAETGSNCCRKCQENHGRIFPADDPERPVIPLHPNCRCRYLPVD